MRAIVLWKSMWPLDETSKPFRTDSTRSCASLKDSRILSFKLMEMGSCLYFLKRWPLGKCIPCHGFAEAWQKALKPGVTHRSHQTVNCEPLAYYHPGSLLLLSFHYPCHSQPEFSRLCCWDQPAASTKPSFVLLFLLPIALLWQCS